VASEIPAWRRQALPAFAGVLAPTAQHYAKAAGIPPTVIAHWMPTRSGALFSSPVTLITPRMPDEPDRKQYAWRAGPLSKALNASIHILGLAFGEDRITRPTPLHTPGRSFYPDRLRLRCELLEMSCRRMLELSVTDCFPGSTATKECTPQFCLQRLDTAPSSGQGHRFPVARSWMTSAPISAS